MQDRDFFPLVEVNGSPYERGRQHGEKAAARVKRSAAIYARALDGFGFPAARLAALIEDFRYQVEAFEPDYLQEMQGIADGAGIPFADVLMINARSEIVTQARLQHQAALQPPPADACTSAAILPARSANGHLLQGQNWDNRLDCAETAIVLRILREDGPDVMTFVEAGGLARYGMNSAGLVLNGNGLSCGRDFQQTGVPLPLIRRKALEQAHFAMALQIVAATPKACSCNVLLGSSLGLSLSLECAPDETFLLYPRQGLLVHANHWVNPVARGKLAETGVQTSPDSLYRDVRVQASLQAAGDKLTLADLKHAFGDEHATPYSVCRPPRPGGQGYESCTTATLLMEPATGRMQVSRLPCLQPRYATYLMARGSAARF
ncbi:C45 family autoproteolytic acyltransferase/hydolase [Bordetella trematum]|uniref:C45 family autoproteolytic acyltransferase/hydolase n=1 Tax=Bordetella trematum TaxID=123899 RepID=UPI0015C54C08|nr:C45 family peptidase [Bordetella trematum]